MEEERKQRELEAQKRAEQIEQDRRSRIEQEEKDKKDKKDKKERELKRERESQATQFCDQLAGNPTDLHRVGVGVSYETLDANAGQAAEYCALAAKQAPSELRFQYQWARAFEHIDADRAFAILQSLVKKRYPAAFDNAGWLFYARRNIPEAINHFRMGTHLGDPDSMVSLAEMFDRGHAWPRTEDETKVALLERAARLGHPGAARSLMIEKEKYGQIEQQRTFQQEQARRMIDIFGGFIQGMRR